MTRPTQAHFILPDGFTSISEVGRDAGLTYRQIDHWVSRGYIKVNIASPDMNTRGSAGRRRINWVWPDDTEANPGSGWVRVVDEREARILRLMARLVRAGMHPPRAVEIARELVDAPEGAPVALGDDLWIST